MSSVSKPARHIEGERIIMVARALEQASEMYALIDRNRSHLGKWMPWERTTQSVQDTIAYLELAQSWWDKGSTFDYTVFDKQSGQLVGSLGLHSIKWDQHQCDIGYWIDEAHQGKGLITEAVKIGEKIAAELGLMRVVITCDSRNHRSSAIPKRLNYVLESVQPEQQPDHHGQHRDTMVYVKNLI